MDKQYSRLRGTNKIRFNYNSLEVDALAHFSENKKLVGCTIQIISEEFPICFDKSLLTDIREYAMELIEEEFQEIDVVRELRF